jgi:alkylhydroperoxidase family enzyme
MSNSPRAAGPGTNTGNVIRDSMMGLVPETVEEIIRLNGHVWRDSLVSASILETLRLRNARTVNCVFCKSVRYDVARADGLTEDKADMISDGYEASSLAPREKAAIALADAYLGFPAGISEDAARRVTDAFDDDEIASMMVSLMTFNFTSRAAVSNGGMPEGPLPITEVSVIISGGTHN